MVRVLSAIFALLFVIVLIGAGGAFYVFYHFGRDLPDYSQLADYEPPITTRIYAGDGRLFAEYAVEKRVFVPIEAIPRKVIDAFLSAEDKNFYAHPGVDLFGVIRAAITNLNNLGTDRRLVGASTITQQVAKNFLLSNEVSMQRKVKEAILAFRMERTLSKDRLLELYLNEIYLGHGSYGVVAAALNYFNKSLDELTLGEAAFLAALPKAPNNYDPIRRPEAAQERRDWVVGRMLEDGHITAADAGQAKAEPLTVRERTETEVVKATYFAEEIRRELAERFGGKALYEGGLVVRATVDPKLQSLADRVLRKGLIAYDRRHGWRGPYARMKTAEGETGKLPTDWQDRLAKIALPPGLNNWRMAVVISVNNDGAAVGFADGHTANVPFAEMKWARQWLPQQRYGREPRRPSDVVAEADVVLVEEVRENSEGAPYSDKTYALRQLPAVDGAVVAIDPHTGRVLAMSGGYSTDRSEFNRATQAKRQPGSAFKPIVYLTALENGYSPATLVLDAPFVFDQGPGLPLWRPKNYAKKYYGLTTMRVGIEKSRNLMTVRLADAVGMDRIIETAKRLDVVDDMPPYLSYALGAGETTLLRLTNAYAMLANGGKRITPTLIDRIQDRHGKTIFRHDERPCEECRQPAWERQTVPSVPDTREPVTDPASAYQMISLLEGVVQRGTGRRIKSIGKPLAGKTGTTNDSRDTWFIGFSPDLAVGVFVGFDEPSTLGNKETGSSVAAPIFKDFMIEALADKPAIPFRIPPGIRLVRVNAATGRRAQPGDSGVIFEAFKPGSIPTARVDQGYDQYGSGNDAGAGAGSGSTVSGPSTGIGGLY
jgi:penicillin-binding protein 1A